MKISGKIEEKVFKVLMVIATYSILAILAIIIYSIFAKGIKALSWEMLTQVPQGGYYYGKGGGILNAILGSLSLACGATFLAFLIGLPVALYINVFLVRWKKMVTLIRFILDLIWGIPSIVYGAFGFSMMILLGLQTSLLAGMLTVTLFILPIMIRSMDEILRTVPIGLSEAAYSLGSNKSELAFKIFTRQTILRTGHRGCRIRFVYCRLHRQPAQLADGTGCNTAVINLLPVVIAGTCGTGPCLCLRTCAYPYHSPGQPVFTRTREEIP